MSNKTLYTVIKYYNDSLESDVVMTGLTLEEAIEMCDDPEVHTEDFFYGYMEEGDEIE